MNFRGLLGSFGRKAGEWIRKRPVLLRLARTPPARALKRAFWHPIGHEQPKHYRQWLSERLIERENIYNGVARPGLLSILTCAWNTDPDFLKQLAQSLLGQKVCHSFEWILLDNGSQNPATKECLNELRMHRQVKFFRNETNLGIIKGLRYCLERASGQYIVPVDHDDYLHPDCLSVLAHFLEKTGYPPLIYSDEDRLQNGQFLLPYHKPSWDPVLFQNSCYIAHLCAIDRTLALKLEAYTEEEAEGSHDWDTFVRFIQAGYTPVHLPEIIYSWRMHPGSCAQDIDSKDFIHSSHRFVLGKLLAMSPYKEHFSLEMSPLFNKTPDWRFERKRIDPRPLLSIVLCHDPDDCDTKSIFHSFNYPDHRIRIMPWYSRIDELRAIAEQERAKNTLIHLHLENIELASDECAWEAVGLMELYPDAMMAGGRIFDENEITISGGEFFGFGGPTGCPDLGRLPRDPGYFAQMLKQHSVSSVPAVFSFIDAGFLAELLNQDIAPSISIPYLGAWAGAFASRTGKRIIYSPFISGKSAIRWQMMVSDNEKSYFAWKNRDLIPETRYFSRSLSLDPASPYSSVTESHRKAAIEAWFKNPGNA